MKKWIIAGLTAVCLSITMPAISTQYVYAGDINADEQELLDYMAGVFEYEGKYYKATDAALARLREELLKDERDLNARQVRAAKNEVMRSFKSGLDGGYMYEVEKPLETTDNSNTTSDSEDSKDESQTTVSSDKETTKSSDKTQNTTDKSDKKEDKTTKSTDNIDDKDKETTAKLVDEGEDNGETNTNIFPQESETYPADVIVNTVDMESIYNIEDVKDTGYNLHPLLWGSVIVLSAIMTMSMYCIRMGEDDDETHN